MQINIVSSVLDHVPNGNKLPVPNESQ